MIITIMALSIIVHQTTASIIIHRCAIILDRSLRINYRLPTTWTKISRVDFCFVTAWRRGAEITLCNTLRGQPCLRGDHLRFEGRCQRSQARETARLNGGIAHGHAETNVRPLARRSNSHRVPSQSVPSHIGRVLVQGGRAPRSNSLYSCRPYVGVTRHGSDGSAAKQHTQKRDPLPFNRVGSGLATCKWPRSAWS